MRLVFKRLLVVFVIGMIFFKIEAQVTPSIDIDGTIQIREGATDGYILQSDAAGKATWVDPSTITGNASNRLCITDFGAVGNDQIDDTAMIQAAIDSAAITGTTVCIPAGIYDVSTLLTVPAGVSLIGEGRGNTSTSTPSNGSIFRNTGTDWTIRVTGQNVAIRDLVVYDTNNASAAGGIELLADATGIESVVLDNVLIFGFTDGTGLKLEAINAGGIAYCSFYNVRVRHAGIGINIKQDASSFVNSNSFYHGAVSGGGFDYCLLVQGGNNNVFNATIFEPFTSTYGHLVVEEGEIIGNRIRIEGVQQPTNVPLMEFKANTSNSYISGTYAGGLTLDRGDNFIDFRNGKGLDFYNAGQNLLENAAFKNIDGTAIPYWEVSDASVTVEVLAPDVLEHHNVLKLTIPVGIDVYLRPTTVAVPQVMTTYKFDQVNFGAYIKTNQADRVLTTSRAPNGIVTGLAHTGDDTWQYNGMTSLVNRTQPYDPKFVLNNATGTVPLEVYISTPTLSFGTAAPQIEAKPVSTAGGIMTGTLSTAFLDGVTIPANGYVVLTKEANVFEIVGTQSLHRINHSTNDRFPKGTIITLLFADAGVSVINGTYINLIGGYTSVANSSLTLIAMGNGTWKEMNRNL